MTTWVKVYNSMPQHPKFVKAGPQAGWLFVCALCYCNEHLTDGFVSRHVLAVVAPGLRSVRAAAAQLVSAQLWHEVDGGWQIHDYEEHQRNADEIRDRREKDRQRKADFRKDSTRSPRGQVAESARSPSVDVEGRRQKAEGEVKTPTSIGLSTADVREAFRYWQSKCDHPNAKLSPERRRKLEARFKDGFTLADICKGIDGAAQGAYVNEAGVRFDDIELICRTTAKLESFMARADGANVVALQPQPAIARANRYQQFGDAG